MSVSDTWQLIGSIATVATFLIYIFLEWSKIREKLLEYSRARNALIKATVGSVVFAFSGALAGFIVIWVGGIFLLPLLDSEYSKSTQTLLGLAYNYSGFIATAWAIIGFFFGLLFGSHEAPLYSTRQERLAGAFLGMIGGAFFSSVIAGIVYLHLDIKAWANLVITWILGGALGGAVIGTLLGKFIRNFIFVLYRTMAASQLPKIENKKVISSINYMPVAIRPGIGNSYFKDRYLDLPSGDIILDKAEFHLQPDSLIFDTNAHISSYLPRADGGKEIELRIEKPISNIVSANFLINSGNSKIIYASDKIGEIILVFKDAPPITTDLKLGYNIREWSIGNQGDWVRELSSSETSLYWKGNNKQGRNAIIDCLKVPVFECMRNNSLEKIIIVHNSVVKPPDTMGVHFSIFAITLEIQEPFKEAQQSVQPTSGIRTAKRS